MLPAGIQKRILDTRRTLWFLAVIIIGLSGCEPSPPTLEAPQPPGRLAFPEVGAYTGAYIEFGETEDVITLEGIEDFEKLVGKHQAIIASSSFWGEQRFPAKSLLVVGRHHAVPLLFWSPWDRPYQEEKGPDRFSLEQILVGRWDVYIDSWADQARAFGGPILVSWGLEMNGNWFPWSGAYYGAGEELATGESVRIVRGPEIYQRAYRYVVERVRARGAENVLWGFHINSFSYPNEPWNQPARYYPGSDYVDWLGASIYGKQFGDDDWFSFHQVMEIPYRELCALDPVKPILVAEWGVGEFPKSGSKAAWLKEAFAAFKSEYPRVKAAIYWHERWMNADSSYTNLRVNSSPDSLEAYRQGVADPYWLSTPQYHPHPPTPMK